DYLRGLLSMYREERLAAQAWLEQAVVNHPQRWQVYAALYDNAAGDRDSEMLNLALSLAAGNPRPQAAHLLEERFPEWREHTRLPGVTVASARFENVTQAAGLAVYRAQRVAWGDYDNDGFADLLLDGKRLLRNVAGTVFVDTALASQVAIVNRATGGVWGDVDNDGYLDVLITRRGDNRLLKNWHGEGFTDITADAFTDLFLGRTEAAAWGDIDNDGWIDLYTANYEVGGLERGFCRPDQLFQNLGDGRFAEHSQALNVVTDEPHCGRGVTWSDIDRDGYQDILVSNYRLDPNLLWKNQAGKGFIDVAGRWGFRGRNDGGAYGHSIGSVAADIDGDRQVDVYVSNLAHPRYLDVSDTSRLLLQNTAGVFSDRSSRSGIGFDETSADPLFADFDNDGDLDLYVTSIYPARVSHLYQNQGYGRFADITAYSGTQTANAWGAAAADYDHDGYLDLLVASRDGVRLFRNLGGANHWLGVRIRSPVCNHFGIGARITVAYGDRTTEREVTAGRGTGSQDPFTAHFGLGDYDGPVEITIRDLCGQIERRKVAVPDRIIEFR
ncbi:MAG: CRTAC1 family protein, partial [Gammaproteobacteria bacterium]|nr:CRTAC1 family protein [Gammaproteobacteria bacterium]